MSTPSLSSIVLSATLKATLKNVVDGGVASPELSLGVQLKEALANGNGSKQCNRFWQSTNRILASGGNESLNVYSMSGIDIGAGAGNDGLGVAMALTSIVGILIENESTSAGSLVVGALGSANQWPNTLAANTSYLCDTIPPGGFYLQHWPDGRTVGSANNNIVKVAASGGAATYNCYILGKQ